MRVIQPLIVVAASLPLPFFFENAASLHDDAGRKTNANYRCAENMIGVFSAQ
jgi:hypothetical protein